MNERFPSYLKSRTLLINVIRFLIDPLGALIYLADYEQFPYEKLSRILDRHLRYKGGENELSPTV
ncbi:MAG: hypothetical protein QMD12_03445 [Candidatus Aenigmarchaeota archaeon]|nr:hypothetical protein [Candidatus Aenigmarchaeota archaeon]